MFHSSRCLRQFYVKNLKFLSRNIKTKVEEPNKIKYTDTINLPKTKFPARLNQNLRTDVEKSIRASHLNNLYNWQRENLSALDEYVLHDGPPYANGDLHMGHAVNKILKDIVLKQKIINKTKVHYVPGWDCHGLPIELKACGNAKRNPLEIREKAKKFALDAVKKQKESFESWGVTGSWNDKNQTYRTFDKDYIKNQLKIFYLMSQRGLIYRDVKPIFFSPSSGSALAEAELEYDENFESPSLYFRCELMNTSEAFKVYALVWTTTPWTLPANQAICINKDLKYCLVKILENHYVVCVDTIANLTKELDCDVEIVKEIEAEELLNCQYKHPVNENEIHQFLDAQHVQADKGTGLVHTAPSHGHDDFLVFLNKQIPLKRLVNEQGHFNENAPEFLRGKEVLSDGNEAVCEHVKASNNIIKLKTIRHSYPIDWRTKRPVIIIASEQWFINTEKIKLRAIQELEKVNIYPEKSAKTSKNVLQVQLEKRPYWCISRQRSWGVPIPVLYDDNKKPVLSEDLINHWISLVEETGSIDFWWQKDVKEMLPKGFNAESNLTKGNDILDIWFDSGISWSHVLKGNKVADLYLEGVDQFTGWFQSSLMTSVGVRGIAPYKNIFVHGFTVDEHGKKMSKSLGNVISPESIVKKYGTDVMRYWIAAHSTQHSLIPVSDKLLEDGANNLVKIRATLKYLLGVIGSENSFDRSKLTHLDKFILHQLSEYVKNSKSFYENFQFNKVTALANNFVNTELSSGYLHLIKDRLYCGFDEEHQQLKGVLKECYDGLCQSLWPIIPFMIEESWSYCGEKSFYEHNLSEKNYNFEESVRLINAALDVKKKVCTLITNGNTLKYHVIINGSEDQLSDLLQLHPIIDTAMSDSELCEILQVSSVTLKQHSSLELTISAEETLDELCPRCRRFSITAGNGVCARCENVLNSK